ncbi:hypothetical protein LCGC14_0982720, partial [marine sediment metagenome]
PPPLLITITPQLPLPNNTCPPVQPVVAFVSNIIDAIVIGLIIKFIERTDLCFILQQPY